MHSKNTARDFFLYLFATFTAYFLAISVITLLWQYVNHFFPAPSYGYYQPGVSAPMRFAISGLLVVFPIYAWVMRFLSKEIDAYPELKDFWVRRWTSYITLFLAAVAIVVDLVVLVNTFLGGDFTLRFILKAAAILVVAALLFWYYLYSLKREPGTGVRTRKRILWIAITVAVLLIIGAFIIVGSPAENRADKFDGRRISDLSSIQWQILSHWRDHGELPESLDEFNDALLQQELPRDPETKSEYEYSQVGDLGFELCATFASESADYDPELHRSGVAGDASLASEEALHYGGYYPNLEESIHWQHGEGRWCFAREIDPEKHSLDDTPVPLPATVEEFPNF